ncbi:unnamed protein product [Urochloa decumbens]|uniref:Uncharacterized protein n=1 Tax=Urochloa decumbens TaxID=240449 RepID=A0ABC8Y605_9POAL
MTTMRLAGDRLRFRRLISFLRHRRLYGTARCLERETGVFFNAARLRQMLLRDRWAAAASYAFRFLNLSDCSREAATLHRYIVVFRVIADLAGSRTLTRADDSRFQRLYDSLLAQPNCHARRRVLLSWRSDRTKASRLYHNTKPKAVDDIMHLLANCPELQPKLSRLPTFHPATSTASPRLWGRTTRHKNKHGRIPAHDIAASFLRKRPPLMSQKTCHSALLPFSMYKSATSSSKSARKADSDQELAVEAVSELVEVDDEVQHRKTVESESTDQLRSKRASRPNPKYYGPDWRSKKVGR